MTSEEPATAVIRAAEGEHIAAAGIEHVFKLTGSLTGGLLGMETFTIAPGAPAVRPHVHRDHDEYFVVLSGQLTVVTGDGEAVLGPGDIAHAPRGSIHGLRNDHPAIAAHGLGLFTPAGYEQYFRDSHALGASGVELTDDVLAQLRRAHATESL